MTILHDIQLRLDACKTRKQRLNRYAELRAPVAQRGGRHTPEMAIETLALFFQIRGAPYTAAEAWETIRSAIEAGELPIRRLH